ncbi:cell wall mannoprotein 1 family protein [Streptomyces sp. NPDC057695]|uniref:cell wall mannoprotein 1 family protein n=1 Tax=Streptomyces sp. NPDC057695 TaxID=3346217 RepID=UPI00367C4E47
MRHPGFFRTVRAAVLAVVLTLSAATVSGTAVAEPASSNQVVVGIQAITSGMAQLKTDVVGFNDLASALKVQSTAAALDLVVKAATIDANNAGQLDQATSDAAVDAQADLAVQTASTMQALSTRAPALRQLGISSIVKATVTGLQQDTSTFNGSLETIVATGDKPAVAAASVQIDGDFLKTLNSL